MTTPPRVREFHLSRTESASTGPDATQSERAAQAARAGQGLFDNHNDGFSGMSLPGSAAAAKATPDDASGDQAADMESRIASVKAEGLTARQLRLARRIAAMHGIEVESEEEAVIRLRDKGIDPFHRSSLSKIVANAGAQSGTAPNPNAPMRVATAKVPAHMAKPGAVATTAAPGPALPSREELTEERRAAEIMKLQRDIARRRRRRFALLMTRLAMFVGLPTLLAAWYYFAVATPLYSTKSQFLIQQADSGGGGGLGGLFSGTQLATNPDSVSVQAYLTSRDAMLRLDRDLGFKRAFQDSAIDPLLRLPENATNERAYEQYKKSVKIGYDPTEGVLNMEVIAPDPDLSEQFSLALIGYAEGQVDQMTARLRGDQMEGALKSFESAESKVQKSQMRIEELQRELGVLDPVGEASVVMAQIATLEGQLAKRRLELGQLEANRRPNRSRVEAAQGDIARLESLIAETRAQLTEANGPRESLAQITGDLRIAEAELRTRQELLAASAAQLETARIEANKQVRYLSLSVAPVVPDEATYPKAFVNTLVSFMLFAGIYLMLSLTASILREQVST